jgi:hypothetical protein
MAKKSRRAKKRARRRRRIPAGGAGQPAPGPTAAVTAKDRAALAEARAAKLAEEYRYVYSDLKRIAILAATMLVALIILSFVIG